MIVCTTGDLFAVEAEALVNPVNCVGVMGRGMALQFETHTPSNPRYIENFPTKRHWRDASSIEDINARLSDLVRVIAQKRIQSIAMPALGCGLGGLNWSEVRSLIEDAFITCADVSILVFEPQI